LENKLVIVNFALLVSSVALVRKIEERFAKKAHIVQEVLILANFHAQLEPMVVT
jgi:hypothetical protein